MSAPKILWPSWRYGPGGQAAIFESPDEVPKGWVDHPRKLAENQVEEADPVDPPVDGPSQPDAGNEGADTKLSLDEIKAQLKEKEVEDLKALAAELELEVKGNKNQLVSKIAKKLFENQ